MDWNILKKFKNQLHLVRSATEAMSQKDIGFNFSGSIDKGVEFNLRFPPDIELARFATVLTPLVDPSSPLCYKNIASLLFENSFLSASDKEKFDQGVQQIETGPIQIKLNEEFLRAVDLYDIYSKGEFFDEHEAATEKLKKLRNSPFIPQYIMFSFHSYCFDIYKVCEYLYHIIRDAEKTRNTSEAVDTQPKDSDCPADCPVDVCRRRRHGNKEGVDGQETRATGGCDRGDRLEIEDCVAP